MLTHARAHTGVEVLLVTSGAVGCGRRQLRKQALLGSTTREQLLASAQQVRRPLTLTKHVRSAAIYPSYYPHPQAAESNGAFYSSACASAGQLGLMSLYDSLFSQ